jgi:acid stress-induced BolA-like protein IbaG/YrbA
VEVARHQQLQQPLYQTIGSNRIRAEPCT